MIYRTGVHHRFDSQGETFAYSADSAAVVALDAAACRVLDEFQTPSGVELDDWKAALASRSDGSHLSESFEELVTIGLVRPLGLAGSASGPAGVDPLPPMPYPLSTLVLNVTNKCNLSCTYCYEYGEDRIVDVGARRTPRMSPETARKSIDMLLERSPGRSEVTITFFGGETLLNFDTIRDAALYAETRARDTGKRVAFALTTNATLLTDEIVAFLAEHRFGVNVSIDGGAADHDRHRRFKSGKGSYETIVPNIQKLLAATRQGRPVGARVTLTRGMADLRETFRHLTQDIGFVNVGFAPVTSSSDRDWSLAVEDMGGLFAGFRALAADYVTAALASQRHGFSNLDDLLGEIHRGTSKAHPCGAGLGLVGVSTDGEIGLCHRFVESGAHAIGDLEHGIDETKRRAFLESVHVSKKLACHECFARPHCSGGCYHEAYVRYADATQPNLHYCEWVRAWTALGLDCYARIALGNAAFLAQFDAPGTRRPAHALEPLTTKESLP